MESQDQDPPTPGKRIVFFADPMCSWCWGFAPVIGAIDAEFGRVAPVRLVLGGLRAGETRPMDDKSKDYIRQHWEHVHTATGQPFDFDFFDRDGFVYDTEPACRAAVAARNLAPGLALAYFEAVQRAFYAGNRDVTAGDTLADIAQSLGIERTAFTTVFEASEIVEATRADFSFTHALGISGFPTVILEDDAAQAFLTIGYRPFEAVKDHIQLWLRA
jgi:putative protein-disulfide isomerase